MGDLIHRDELKQTLLDLGFYPAIVKSALEKAPTIDAVEVVRCRECKHWLKDVTVRSGFVGRCDFANYMVGVKGYCSYGERKEDA